MEAVAFGIVSLLSLLFFFTGISKDRRLLYIIICWQLFVGSLAYLHLFEDHPILLPAFIIATIVLTILTYKQIVNRELNEHFLLAIHILRIPVELILFRLYLLHKIPILMTFKGYNFDILIGISAFLLLMYELVSKKKVSRCFFVVWNCLGLIFLFIIVTLAILCSPLPIQLFAFDQPNIAVLEFPFCYLPFCVVPIVLLSHVLLIRKKIRV